MRKGNADIHMFLREQFHTNQPEVAEACYVLLEPWLHSYLGSLAGYFDSSQMQALWFLFPLIYDLV